MATELGDDEPGLYAATYEIGASVVRSSASDAVAVFDAIAVLSSTCRPTASRLIVTVADVTCPPYAISYVYVPSGGAAAAVTAAASKTAAIIHFLLKLGQAAWPGSLLIFL